MTWPAFILIVLSAGLHASWNLVAKKNRISLPFYALICSVGAVCCFNIHFWTPVPVRELSLKFWGSVLGSTWSDIFYCLGLVYCYRKLEMASAYPVMRALPIILTAIVTTIFGLGKSLTLSAVPGFLIVFAGALMMPLEQFRDFKSSTYLNPSLLFILAVACGTTGYTVFDSICVGEVAKIAPEVPAPLRSLSYNAIRSTLLTSQLLALSLLIPSQRKILAGFWKERNYTPFLAGLFACGCYIMVLIAMNYVSNVAYVQVFRQLGLPIGTLLGVLILKEKGTPVKWTGVTLIVLGLIISVIK